MKWRWFAGSAILAAYFLWSVGAPLPAVAAGIIGTALWNFWKRNSNAAGI